MSTESTPGVSNWNIDRDTDLSDAIGMLTWLVGTSGIVSTNFCLMPLRKEGKNPVMDAVCEKVQESPSRDDRVRTWFPRNLESLPHWTIPRRLLGGDFQSLVYAASRREDVVMTTCLRACGG